MIRISWGIASVTRLWSVFLFDNTFMLMEEQASLDNRTCPIEGIYGQIAIIVSYRKISFIHIMLFFFCRIRILNPDARCFSFHTCFVAKALGWWACDYSIRGPSSWSERRCHGWSTQWLPGVMGPFCKNRIDLFTTLLYSSLFVRFLR